MRYVAEKLAFLGIYVGDCFKPYPAFALCKSLFNKAVGGVRR